MNWTYDNNDRIDRTALILGHAQLIKAYFNNLSFHKSESPSLLKPDWMNVFNLKDKIVQIDLH